MKNGPRRARPESAALSRLGLVDFEVGPTREHQSGDRPQCDGDPAHELHVDSLLLHLFRRSFSIVH